MADHSKPTTASTYTNFVTELDARLDDLAYALDPAVTTATNVPTNTVRWSSAAAKWQKYNGTAWVDLAASYAISITGSAGSAATLTTARNINGTSFNGSADVTVEPYVEADESTNATRYMAFVDNATAGYQRLNFDSGLSYNPSTNTLTTTTFSGALSGNASTATTLQTARTINGVSFNGSANITVNTNNALTFNNSGAGVASGSTFNGSAAATVSYNTVGAPSTTGTGASGSWPISVTGNAATVTNGVYTTGDQSIGGNKTFTGNTTLSSAAPTLELVDTDQAVLSGGKRRVMNDAGTLSIRRNTASAGDFSTYSNDFALDASGNLSVAGQLTAPGMTVTSVAPTIDLTDTTTTRTRKLHHNEDLMGFLKTDGSWDMYVNNAGQIYTPTYGWLHGYFFNAVDNQGNVTGNTTGTGAFHTRYPFLVDNGGSLTIKSWLDYYNCNCNCDCSGRC